jgi:hypothetical protein
MTQQIKLLLRSHKMFRTVIVRVKSLMLFVINVDIICTIRMIKEVSEERFSSVFRVENQLSNKSARSKWSAT